jgi:hypothetical protein
MEELLKQLKDKTGLPDDVIEKVAGFIKDHAAEIPKWIGGGALGDLQEKAGGMLGGLGGMLGGDKD